MKHHHSAREAVKDGSLASFFKNRTNDHPRFQSGNEIVHFESLPKQNPLGIVFHGVWFTIFSVVFVVGFAFLAQYLSNHAGVQTLSSSLKKRLLSFFGRSQSAILKKSARRSTILSQALSDANRRVTAGGSKSQQTVEMVELPPAQLYNPLGVNMILTRMDVSALTPHIPARYRHLKRWELVFSTSKHGYRLEALYDSVRERSRRLGTPAYSDPFVLVVRTTSGNKIGAYGSHSLIARGATGSRFAGNGETLIFSLYPNERIYGVSSRLARTTQHYWSTTNSSLAFGGAKEAGLWLDKQLEHGRSEGCTTFASTQPLTGHGNEAFLCSAVELWSLSLVN